jgi:hypothetical protein
VKDEPGRVKEQRTDLEWALKSILAHIERGMIVEIRFVPPAPSVPADSKEGAKPMAPEAFKTLQTIAPQLPFPKLEGPPILKIPPAPSADPRNE